MIFIVAQTAQPTADKPRSKDTGLVEIYCLSQYLRRELREPTLATRKGKKEQLRKIILNLSSGVKSYAQALKGVLEQ
jgi:hypothetical protein